MEKNISDFKNAYESPSLYLDNFFSNLRNQVDIEAELKLIKFHDNFTLQDRINHIRQNTIENINSFEEECFDNLNAHYERIYDFFEKILNAISLENREIKEAMFIDFKKVLFSNKGLYFALSDTNGSENFGCLISIDNIFSEKIANDLFWLVLNV